MKSLTFVVCPAYHGATFLSLLLNNHSRVSSLGDTIPARRHLSGTCSCGRVVRDCPFWSSVLDAIDAGRRDTGPKVLPLWPRVFADYPRLNRAAAVSMSLAARSVGDIAWSPVAARRNEYAELYERFAEAILRGQNTDLFVDGSKSMSKAFVLASIFPEATVRVLHLIRDPRDYYCSHEKNRPDSSGLRSTARGWRDRHLAILALARLMPDARYLRIRYEDLCDDPETTLSSVFAFLDVGYENVLHAPVDPGRNHVIGSRSKSRFDGTIRASRGWRDRLTPAQASTIGRWAWPLFGRFGYQ